MKCDQWIHIYRYIISGCFIFILIDFINRSKQKKERKKRETDANFLLKISTPKKCIKKVQFFSLEKKSLTLPHACTRISCSPLFIHMYNGGKTTYRHDYIYSLFAGKLIWINIAGGTFHNNNRSQPSSVLWLFTDAGKCAENIFVCYLFAFIAFEEKIRTTARSYVRWMHACKATLDSRAVQCSYSCKACEVVIQKST